MSAAAASVVDSGRLRAAFDIRHGGRMISLLDVARDREWLAQQVSGSDAASYGDDFTQREIYGWDEMLPTIDACFALGVSLPDHGEIWAVPWRLLPSQHIGSLHLEVDCLALPLTLRREVWSQGDDIVLHYQAVNRGPYELPVLWAAHPQFRVSGLAKVRFPLPPQEVEIVSPPDLAGPTDWARVGRLAAQQPAGAHVKIWLAGKDNPRSVTLQDEGSTLRIGWDGDCVGYVAVLWDNAQFSRQRIIAIEPSTAGCDSLAEAIEDGDVARLPAGGSLSWKLTLSVGGVEE